MASTAQMKPIREALTMESPEPGLFHAAPHSDYCFGDWALGGYLVSLIQVAAVKHGIIGSDKGPLQPDVLNVQLQFLRPVKSKSIDIAFKTILVNKSFSTLHVSITQDGKDCVMGYVNLADLQDAKGPSLPTNWELHPPPAPVTILELESNTSPNWIRYTTPYSKKGWFRIHSLLKFHFSLQPAQPSLTEHWITPSDPRSAFTNDSLGIIADLWLPFTENYNPASAASHARIIEIAKQQKASTDGRTSELSDRLHRQRWTSPTVTVTQSITLHMKKRLPQEGVKWLFVRVCSRTIEKGKFDVEVLIFDQAMQLVAVGQLLFLLIDFRAELRDRTAAKATAANAKM